MVEHEGNGDSDTNCTWCTWNNPQKTGVIETIKTTALLRLVRIHSRVLESCCHIDSRERPPIKTGVKNLQVVNSNIFSTVFLSISMRVSYKKLKWI